MTERLLLAIEELEEEVLGWRIAYDKLRVLNDRLVGALREVSDDHESQQPTAKNGIVEPGGLSPGAVDEVDDALAAYGAWKAGQ